MNKSAALFFGNDEFLVSCNAKAFADSLYEEQERDLSLDVIDGNCSKIEDACLALEQFISGYQTLGLFGGKKTAWLKNASFLGSPIIIKNDKIKGLLNKIMSDLRAGLSSDQNIIISASNIDKRSSFFKAFAEYGEVNEHVLSERDYEARPIALQRLKEKIEESGMSINKDAADYFVDQVGYDTRQIMCEIEKLILFKNCKGSISKKDVEAITAVTGEAIIWDFTDSIAERRLEDAIHIFRRLIFQKESPIKLIIGLEGLYSDLLQYRVFADEGWVKMDRRSIQWKASQEADEFLSSLSSDPRKKHWFRSSKLLSQSLSHSQKRLEACCKIIISTHEQMISEGSLSHEILFEILLARLCGKKLKTRAPLK